jgi:hypothetical protein
MNKLKPPYDSMDAVKRPYVNLAIKQTEALESAYEEDNPDFLPERDGPESRGLSGPVNMFDDTIENQHKGY